MPEGVSMRSRNEVMTPDFVTCGGGPAGDPNGELAQLHVDLRDFLQHVIDMSKGDHYWDVVRGNAEALLRRDALRRQ